MSASIDAVAEPMSQQNAQKQTKAIGGSQGNYKGFVAGVFSGIAKLSGMCLRGD